MKDYIKMKFIYDYIVPIIIFVMMVLIFVVMLVSNLISFRIKQRYLKNQGYAKKINFYDGLTGMKLYNFVKGDRSISETRVDRMSYKELRRFIEDGHQH